MNFSEQTITILDYICNKFGVAIDWSSENIWPTIELVASKYIKWEMVSSSIWLIIWLLGFTFCTFMCVKIYKGVEVKYGWDDAQFFGILVFALGAFGFFCGLYSQVFDIAKCIVFPELKFFEYLKETLNAMSK